jgi:hypothetical protein
MTKLLIAIDRRTRYLDKAFPRGTARSRQAMIDVELPDEAWSERYQGIRIPASVMPSIERIYGAEAVRRGESPIVTMVRCAANAGSHPEQVDQQTSRQLSQTLYSLCLALPDDKRAKVEKFIIEHSQGGGR